MSDCNWNVYLIMFANCMCNILWCNCNDNGNALAKQIPVFEGWIIVFGIRFLERPFCVYSTLKASRAGRKFLCLLQRPVTLQLQPSGANGGPSVWVRRMYCVWTDDWESPLYLFPSGRPVFRLGLYFCETDLIHNFDNLKWNFILIYNWHHLKSFCHLYFKYNFMCE